MLNLSHKKLTVWKKSIELNSLIYEITQELPREEQYGLSSQMRRSSVSVSSNISEGASRISLKEKARFFEIARSSLVELDTQLEIAFTLGYIGPSFTEKLDELINTVFAMLTNLIRKVASMS